VPTLSVYIRNSVYERLVLEAKSRNVAVTALIVQILEEWVRQLGKEKVQDRP
jgi:predicted HicB family RNase H-like nuclease